MYFTFACILRTAAQATSSQGPLTGLLLEGVGTLSYVLLVINIPEAFRLALYVWYILYM